MDNNNLIGEVAARRVVGFSFTHNGLGRPTEDTRPIDNNAENLALSNDQAGHEQRAIWREGAIHPESDSLILHFMHDRHRRMSRMLGLTLFNGEPNAWAGFSIVAATRLTLHERAGLAVAALRSLPDEHSVEVAASALGAVCDPLPPFLGGMEDARSWAQSATKNERKAYALACFEAMEPKDRAAFVRHIGSVEVAA